MKKILIGLAFLAVSVSAFALTAYEQCRCKQQVPGGGIALNDCCVFLKGTGYSWPGGTWDGTGSGCTLSANYGQIYIYHTYVNNSTVTLQSSPTINPCPSADAASVCYPLCVGPQFGVPYCGTNPSTGTNWKAGDACNKGSFTSCLTTTADSCDTYKIVSYNSGGPLQPRRCAPTAAACTSGPTYECLNGPGYCTSTLGNPAGGPAVPDCSVECYAYQCYCAFYVNNYAYCG